MNAFGQNSLHNIKCFNGVEYTYRNALSVFYLRVNVDNRVKKLIEWECLSDLIRVKNGKNHCESLFGDNLFYYGIS